MAKLIISGDLKEQDIMLIAKFFREFWKHRPENIFLMIEEGTANLSVEQTQAIFRKIFTEGETEFDDWTTKPIDEEMIRKFKESLK